jgi:hypothetical protein
MLSSVGVASLRRSIECVWVHEQEGGLVRTPGVPATGDRRATMSGLSSSYGARIEAKGLSRGIGTLMFPVVVASLRIIECVGCMSRRGGSFGRPGSQPQVIDGRPRAALSSSCGARIESKGLS